MSHENITGECLACQAILNTFPRLNRELRNWFESKQKQVRDFHVSEGGRGRERQELMVKEGHSKAHYPYSAHNYNCAIDTFFLIDKQYSLDPVRYKDVVKGLPPFIKWYGAPGAEFYERPHFEKADWRELAKEGLVSQVDAEPLKKIG